MILDLPDETYRYCPDCYMHWTLYLGSTVYIKSEDDIDLETVIYPALCLDCIVKSCRKNLTVRDEY